MPKHLLYRRLLVTLATMKLALKPSLLLEEYNYVIFIQVMFSVIMILTCVINTTIIYVLISMKQTRNPSMRLILFLSISGLSLGLLGEPLLVALLSRNFPCGFHSLVEFLTVTSAHMSAYVTGCIGYDR